MISNISIVVVFVDDSTFKKILKNVYMIMLSSKMDKVIASSLFDGMIHTLLDFVVGEEDIGRGGRFLG